jgi:hypothetical protein
MSTIFKVPPIDSLSNDQFFQVPVADGLLAGYQVDKATRTYYSRESQIIIPSMHGITHVSEDPIPDATCDLHGLMPADDKCKLDTLLQMRLGILGYQGAGFPDDGGFLTGDIILAAGSEFISIERVGNTVRFSVDSPIPLNCGCESCSQIFWIQDESEPRAIRPPSCNGIIPDVSSYGELKVYLLPSNAIVDPQDPLETLSTKGQYPAFIFKRYDNGITPYEANLDVILRRNENNTTNVGWAFTPSTVSHAQCIWWMGSDKNGGQIKFEFWPDSEPNLFGSLLYRGHLITKMPCVIIGYEPDVLTTNRYILSKWDLKDAQAVGSSFVATNVWRYLNPTTTSTGSTGTSTGNPKTLVTDNTVGILQVGTIVDIYQIEISRSGMTRIVRSYFTKEPNLNPAYIWGLTGAVQFGDLLTAREEINQQNSSAITASELGVSDVRLFEKGEWGLTNFEDRLLLSDNGTMYIASDGITSYDPSSEPVNNDIVADVDSSIPGLKISKTVRTLQGDIDGDGTVTENDLKIFACAYGSSIGDANYNAVCDFNNDGKIDVKDLAIIGQYFDLGIDRVSDRPVFLWHRANHKNVYVKMKLGMPLEDAHVFPPYDLLLDAPVDSFDDTYMKVMKRGIYTAGPFTGSPYIIVKGQHWRDLPSQGIIRILTGAFRNTIWRYYYKTAFAGDDSDSIILVGRDYIFPFDDDFPILNFRGTSCTATGATDVPPPDDNTPRTTIAVELLHQDYSGTAMRFQFDINHSTDSEAVQLQIIVGTLDMTVAYPQNVTDDPRDDLVRGFSPGYTVSSIMIQQGFITDGIGAGVVSNPANFKVYEGGELPVPVDGQTEKWNEVEVMYRDGEVWLWWNGLLVPPDTVLSSQLTTPVAVNTPYYPVVSQLPIGKVALRMFPGAVMRSMEIRDQQTLFNEFMHQQLQLTT